MSEDWKDKPRAFQGQMQHATRQQPVRPALASPSALLHLNLGIDFGTSFTKICYRDVATEETGIVLLSGTGQQEALIPSIVYLGKDGALSLEASRNQSAHDSAIHYLKMRLADVSMPGESEHVGGWSLTDPVTIQALAAFFLASVMRKAKGWILAREREWTRGRRVVWSANVGVPVEHYDSPKCLLFREVLAVAWVLTSHESLPHNIDEATGTYTMIARTLDVKRSDCQAIPEIAAAVQSFISSRGAQPGIYLYFDVGGGTVDGVAFKFLNDQGQRHINFYSGKVKPLGIAAAAHAVALSMSQIIEDTLTSAEPPMTVTLPLEGPQRAIQRLVALTVMTAKRKDSRDWWHEAIQSYRHIRRDQGTQLTIFIGGGGALSKWYQQALLSTYTDHRLNSVGIPPFHRTATPKPINLKMGNVGDTEFYRFAIAYGLSVPFGEGPEVKLPSQFDDIPLPQRQKRAAHIVDYRDSKDVYD